MPLLPKGRVDLELLEEADVEDEMDESDSGNEMSPRGFATMKTGFQIKNEVKQEEEEDDDDDDSSDEANVNDVFPCQECQALFGAKRDLRAHFRAKHHTSCYWTCRTCGQSFEEAEGYKAHLVKTHKLQKECFTFDNPEENPLLKPYLTMPQDIRPCPECKEVLFAGKAHLKMHQLRKHITKRLTKNVPCPFDGCGMEVEDLSAHAKNAHGIDGVVCPHCGKILSKNCTLIRHIEQVHLNLQIHKPATCNDCGKVFSKKGHLDRHIRTIHMGIKESSEPCPHCGKVFSTKSSLEPHIDMVHKGVRRKCTVCGKVLSDLWKHMRTVHGYYRRKAKISKEDLDLTKAEELQGTPEKQPKIE